jgi:hypothetical protein
VVFDPTAIAVRGTSFAVRQFFAVRHLSCAVRFGYSLPCVFLKLDGNDGFVVHATHG